MARPLWSDKGNDPQAVAEHLQKLADTATTLRFTPEAAPAVDAKVLHQAALLRVRQQLASSHAEADRILAQEVRAIDDLVRTANLLVERLREWYALHAPEATRMVTDAETLARLVADKGDRTAVMQALDQARAAESSLGSDLDPADLAVVRGFAAALTAVHDSWHALERRVHDAMETVAPNLASVVGPVIGARLIALSGGLNRLATWPAGTVQLLGAETALFRHIKEGAKPPKHGILFQHPNVHQAPAWQRGPNARILALAAAKAAKADAFTKNDLRPLLAAEVKEGLERIQRERPRPPQRKTFGGPTRGFSGKRSGPPGRGPARGPMRGGAPHRAPAPRFGERAPGGDGGGWSRPSGPRYDRGPPRDGPRGGFGEPVAPARRVDDRGASRAPDAGFDAARAARAAAFDAQRGSAAGRRFDGPPRAGPGTGYGGSFRDGPRGDARRDDRGPPRDGPRGFGGQGGKFGAPRRKPAGAFRGDGSPAKPPGGGKKPPARREGFDGGDQA